MESEKRLNREGSRTPMYICVGFLSLAVVASLGLSYYTIVSLNNFRDSLPIQYQPQRSAYNDNSKEAIKARTKRQTDGEEEPDTSEPTAVPGPRYIGTVEEEKQGAIYTRWGALGCRRDSAVVYVGETAAAYWHLSGGTNYLCIPAGGMEWLGWNQNVSATALLMGTDYQTSFYGDRQLFVNEEGKTTDLDNTNVPCAICQATNKLSQLMIPGKTTCPDETWRIEYQGYLMTSADTNENQSEFICVDVFAQPYPVNEGNSVIGSHVVHVKGYCAPGSGDIWGCATHEHNREIACVVCSK